MSQINRDSRRKRVARPLGFCTTVILCVAIILAAGSAATAASHAPPRPNVRLSSRNLTPPDRSPGAELPGTDRVVAILGLVRQCVDVLFYVVAGTVTVLTYLKARRTVLMPLRTEVFKIQLAEVRRLLEIVCTKDELELREHFDFRKIIGLNVQLLLAQVAKLKFGAEVDLAALLRGPMIVPLEALEPADDRQGGTPGGDKWTTYEHRLIRVTEKFHSSCHELKVLKGSPVMPRQIAEAVSKLLATVEYNISQIGVILGGCRQEIEDRYRTIDELKEARPYFIENAYNSEFRSLQEYAERINDVARRHFGTDGLMDD